MDTILAVIYVILAVLPAYFISSLNSAIIVTKIAAGKDIRQLGSHNAGLTNTLRCVGKKAAAVVLFGDAAKGVLSVFAVKGVWLLWFGLDFGSLYNLNQNFSWLFFLAGTAACLGHTFPLYYRFKGGKGILVTCAALYATDWRIASASLAVFILIVIFTRYVSLGSVIAAATIPAGTWVFTGNVISTCISAVTAAILIIMHRANIKRLITHTENKLGKK
ncbi:glycerol-3-phosphate acyltransferase [Clostridia bacterium]|nr:glycerol-3-phosphate acyltransferase [Clostridia bacterium]